MKHDYLILIALISFTFSQAQIVNIPDANFKNMLVNGNCVDTVGDRNGDEDADTNDDGEIQVSEAEAVLKLNVSSRYIASLEGIEAFVNLQELTCWNNQLSTLNVSSLENLNYLNCANNDLTILGEDNLPNNLSVLSCSNNLLTTLEVNSLTNLNNLSCGQNQLTDLDLGNLINITNLNCYYNNLTNLILPLSSEFNLLDCSVNQLTSLDLSGLSSLEELNCSNNQLNVLDVSALTSLLELNCYSNQLVDLNIGGLSNCTFIDCSRNQIPELDLSNLTNLAELNVSNNQLTTLDLESLLNLVQLTCSGNQLAELNVNALINLTYLDCNSNQFSTLDVNNLINLNYLNCYNNSQLTSLFIKNGSQFDSFNFLYTNNLEFICVDEEELNAVKNQAIAYGNTDCVVNTYCSFVPGGSYSIIEGSVTFDLDNNGCDLGDPFIPNIKFNITDGTVNGTIIPDTSGNYSISVQEGIHEIYPVLENSEYFTIIPESISIDFPSETSPYNLDFCVTQNGSHNDLEIVIIPMEEARPGFDTDYKIIYKNKGNTVISNSLEFSYNENAGLMELVSSEPNADEHVDNVLTWDFMDLMPFETREILVTMNLNSPTDTPPLNGGDDLGFVANIFPITGDEIPGDNNFQLKQVVVNSFDPNDKTCLQGETIAPEDVGKYVHYLIRFENTGTASAVNVVIKDEIDLAKYDVSTLIPLDGSHDFVTRIKDDNIVEFIFENINLPFDDANNDGYVLFKIKTLETLELGDTFSNDAEIYFDYNAPIITNDELTTVAENLSVEETELQNLITVYPNPAADVIILESKTNLESIIVYDVHGRQVLTQLTSTNQLRLNVSKLVKGIYFLNLKTVDGEQTTKFIKK
ncbi:T9SS type A sorting domain-containing protein [Hanstruepera ponticola]|uniref:T9SS type A sorting domain-containing protein n=1 Tax=Hanstruepera ponticola TaxID=2042995 RepID=UPI000CF0D388|nr:T9SS type A sorting domain-containing protein [Hanstruepera ponticola]